MLLRLILVCNCIYHVVHASAEKCLMGDMTDVQSWVQQNGALKVMKANTNDYVDLSTRRNPVAKLQQRLSVFRTSSESVKYLSMARCDLYKVPTIFSLADSRGRYLSNTLEYLTFYGNQFVSTSVTGEQYDSNINATGARETNGIKTTTISPYSLWSSSFQTVNFSRLKELDLRACSIQTLNANIFSGMSKLEALYLSENEIQVIQSKAFVGLSNLKHLDLSHNHGYDQEGKPIDFASNPYNTFEGIKRLESLDLTGTKLTAKNLEMISIFGKTLQSLSLCSTNLMSLGNSFLNGTSLKVLDISWNLGIMSRSTLEGLEDTLTVLYAMKTGITTTSIFQNFTNLEILQISYNEIKHFSPSTAATLPNLKYLDLSKNRLTTWFKPTYSLMPSLRYLSLKDNNINVITNELIDDIKYVEYIALSNNFIVCSCMAKDLYKIAYLNENQNGTSVVINKKRNGSKAYCEYESLIKGRNKIEYDCNEQCQGDIERDTGVFRLVDYVDDSYTCLIVEEGISVEIKYITSCGQQAREIIIHPEILNGHNYLLALIAIPCLLVPLLVLFLFRRYIRYWYITMRNSAMLSLISNDEVIDDGTIFNYDVFVSYCNEDRGWVLDHLLPQIESDCTISVCLHERDFQVGLSILENIVSCMDRSRSIMLIISQRFLLSQWCQFEMHLAQHRLLETRREDLTLVLLEDIPRRLRPNTLHYLMLTKTYIVWPKDQTERTVFWRRLKKSLVSAKNKQESVSIA